jgi:hypothetical protein
MKKITTLCVIVIAMQLHSQMVITRHGWSYYSSQSATQKYGEKTTPLPGRAKLSFNKNNNGLVIIHTNHTTDTLSLTQVKPVFTSTTGEGYKYLLYDALMWTPFNEGCRLQIVFAEKTLIRLFYPNGWKEFTFK